MGGERSWRSASTATARRSCAVDDRGEATRDAITWLDTRAGAEAEELAAASGVRGWALGGLPAALWVERHEPAVAAATRWYLATWEWLAFRLAGVGDAPRSSRTSSSRIRGGRGRGRRPGRRAPAARSDRARRSAA